MLRENSGSVSQHGAESASLWVESLTKVASGNLCVDKP